MAANPATIDDLTARSFRTLTDQEKTVGTTLLGDAFNVIVSTVPTVADRLDATPVDAAFKSLVVQIECAMVLRVLNNPDGKLSETIDDYTYRLDAATSTGALYLSDAELSLLSAGDDAADGAFTISPAGVTGGKTWTSADTWV